MNKSDDEWKKSLTPEQYHICREAGTEPPFTGDLLHMKDAGKYLCIACGQTLFESNAKFESGSGWPSFYQPASKNVIMQQKDSKHGIIRTEVLCANCQAHLGHVFEDGPKPTGLRYCINSIALSFESQEKDRK